MKERDFIKELKLKFDRTTPDDLFIFDDIHKPRKLAYCHWMTDEGIISTDYQIINNEVKQITAS